MIVFFGKPRIEEGRVVAKTQRHSILQACAPHPPFGTFYLVDSIYLHVLNTLLILLVIIY